MTNKSEKILKFKLKGHAENCQEYAHKHDVKAKIEYHPHSDKPYWVIRGLFPNEK